MRKFASRLTEDAERRIRQAESTEPDVVLRALTLTEYMEATIGRLKAYTVNYAFRSEDEEIRFFKEIKPGLYRYLIYYRKIYYIEINRPHGCIEQQREYLNRELSRLQSYFERRHFLYRYYRCGATYLDGYFFLRKNIHLRRPEHYEDSFAFERDPSFSTLCDFGIAKFMAHEMLQTYLLDELARLDSPCGEYAAVPTERITWTHSKTELIEWLIDSGRVLYEERYGHLYNMPNDNPVAVRMGRMPFTNLRIRLKPTAPKRRRRNPFRLAPYVHCDSDSFPSRD